MLEYVLLLSVKKSICEEKMNKLFDFLANNIC
jgi:hypothetical protein